MFLPHLSLMEVVALPHLYAVKDVVTGGQHRLVVTIDKGVACQQMIRGMTEEIIEGDHSLAEEMRVTWNCFICGVIHTNNKYVLIYIWK